MNNKSENNKELLKLLNELREQVITEEGFKRLEEIIAADASSREIYLDYYKICGFLHTFQLAKHGSLVQMSDDDLSAESPDMSKDILLKLLSCAEETAPEVEIEDNIEPESDIIETIPERSGKPNKFFRIYNSIVSVAAVLMILFIIYANIFPPQLTKEVATVKDQLQVEWNTSSARLTNDERILTNQAPYELKKGIIQIAYDQNVDVVIEGPAKFQFERAGIFLEYGSLYSMVSESGIGFRVDTPTCQFIDLGTEFGIKADNDGSSEMHVVKGKVQMHAEGNSGFKTVREFNASRYNVKCGVVNDIPFNPENFVRYIKSKNDIILRGKMCVDLADFVGGGNGFGAGLSGGGIDLETGKFNARYVRYGRMHIAEKAIWSPVPSNSFVDSVFVVDGSKGPQTVSTHGHQFEFPKTDRRFHHDIFYSASAQTMLPADEMADDENQTEKMTLDGISYGVENHPALFIHAPSGITFDLTAIRESLPGLEICRFQSVVGIPDSEREDATIDIIVLVDGISVFQQKHYTVDDSSIELDIPITPESRFLTLAVTDGGDGAWWDLCAFGEPNLKLSNK